MLGHRKAQEGANIAECLTFSSNGARPSGLLPSLRHAQCKEEWRQGQRPAEFLSGGGPL
jgi:hypothetical protein